MPRSVTAVVWVLAAVLLAGCHKEKPAPPKNLLEWFQQKQSATETPDGPIDVNSVRTTNDTTDEQTVEYQTVKGDVRKTWKMRYRSDGKGGYEPLGEPVEITGTE